MIIIETQKNAIKRGSYMEITTEDIIVCIINSTVFGIAILSAYATKFQKEKYIYYPWAWFIMGILPLFYSMYQMLHKHIYSIKEILFCILVVIEAILTYILVWKLISPAREILKKQERIQREEVERKKAIDRPLVEKMKYARAMERKAQYGLHLPKFSKELRVEAEEANMSIEEYKKWCKKTIEQYEIMVREYNSTHSEQWQY